MATFLVRVALPDRPGALGAVASRIGSVRGDVVGVEIVERQGGAAVDEFVVELPDESLLSLLLAEIAEVDGARVEGVHPLGRAGRDRRLEAYDGAAGLVGARSHQAVLDVLVGLVQQELHTSWVAVVDTTAPVVVAVTGRAPGAPWLAAQAPSAIVAPPGDPTGDLAADVAWATLAAWDLVLAAGRPGWRFGVHERRRLGALARLADARWSDLADRDGRGAQPTSLV